MLRSLLDNLLTNAVKYSSREGDVIISTTKKDNMVITEIIDKGVGIAEDELEKLFKIGVKFCQKGTDGETGTGLGLILCDQYIKKLGGEILVKSKLGHGSVFSFTLPEGTHHTVLD